MSEQSQTSTPVRSFVAIGDSFTEGLADDRGDGVFRGWADLVAQRLAEQAPGLRSGCSTTPGCGRPTGST